MGSTVAGLSGVLVSEWKYGKYLSCIPAKLINLNSGEKYRDRRCVVLRMLRVGE